ncbi:MAG: CsiV family protein [Pseudomonadales bacterium]
MSRSAGWGVGLGALLIGLCHPGHSRAAELTDAFEHDWYEVEFFVFERTEVMEHTSDERLVLHAPRSLPLQMVAPLPGPEGFAAYYQVDTQTRLCLDYPTLEIRPLDAAEPESGAVPVQAGDGTPAAAESAADDFPPAAPGVPADTQTLTPEPPTARERLLTAIAAFEQELLDSALQWLPQESLQLRSEARRIERSGTGRLLFHGRWRMPVPPRTAPNPLLLSAGESLAPLLPGQELLGTVGVTLGRYLHFRADLFFEAPALDGSPVSVFADGSGFRREVPAPSFAGGYMKLSESRRMRSAELHYLDHPKLGLVVRIDPVVIPAPLLESFNNLEEPLQ